MRFGVEIFRTSAMALTLQLQQAFDLGRFDGRMNKSLDQDKEMPPKRACLDDLRLSNVVIDCEVATVRVKSCTEPGIFYRTIKQLVVGVGKKTGVARGGGQGKVVATLSGCDSGPLTASCHGQCGVAC